MLINLAGRVLPAVFALIVFSGCEKDDDEKEPTRREILTSGQWRVTAVTANPPITPLPGGPPITDLFAFFDACEKDNYYVFKNDGTAELNEGPTKCEPDDPQSSTVNWTLNQDETQITVDNISGNILEMTSNQMRIRSSVPIPGQTNQVTAEVTFTK